MPVPTLPSAFCVNAIKATGCSRLPCGSSNQLPLRSPAGSLFPQLKPSEGVFKVIFWLGYFNSCVNPLIYPCSSREFKRAFLRLLRCQCRRRRRRRPLWRVYGHHWRAASGQHPDCDPGPGAAPPGASLALIEPSAPGSGSPEGPAPVPARRKPGCAFREWRLLGPLRRPATQLRAKVSGLSHKIRSGTAPRAEAASALRPEVEAVSLSVPHDSAEGAACQAYDLADYGNLRETDI
ncbi:Alpha-1D adrenergic receptor [Galemys pyrenaicus]|uniref:Alpha-1D adrenergic receptor n=1 Tax=Galemys pyrenaicus TaxID=202257 RepID=A0A8J6DMA9_GALPY|nr:Alpha-1D adrenergic receptor [Galemys pyrenaicus]